MNSKWSEEGGRENRMELDRNDSSTLYSFLNTCKSLPDSTNAQDFRGSCKPANGGNMLRHRLQMLMLGTPSRVKSGAAICPQHSYSCKKKKKMCPDDTCCFGQISNSPIIPCLHGLVIQARAWYRRLLMPPKEAL